MHALIVDDSLTARIMMAYALKEMGFDVSEASNGFDALHFLRQGPLPDLMTLDWNMPGLNGGQVLDALQKEPGLKPAKIMVVTSETDMKMVGESISLGGDEYLMKPYSVEAVTEKLQVMGFFPVLETAVNGRD
jgi:two-component system chemotaxis response regulator CheY